MNDTNTEPMLLIMLIGGCSAVAVPNWVRGEAGVFTWITTLIGGLALLGLVVGVGMLVVDAVRGD